MVRELVHDPILLGAKSVEATPEDLQTAQDLLELGVIDKIIPELGGANLQTIARITDYMKQQIEEFIESYKEMTAEQIVEDRYQRFRKF